MVRFFKIVVGNMFLIRLREEKNICETPEIISPGYFTEIKLSRYLVGRE